MISPHAKTPYILGTSSHDGRRDDADVRLDEASCHDVPLVHQAFGQMAHKKNVLGETGQKMGQMAIGAVFSCVLPTLECDP